MTKRIFIGGIHTNIGKTFITCKLLEYYNKTTSRALGLKPVISGFDTTNPQESDSYQLITSQALPYNDSTLNLVSPWRLTEPLSPDIAARKENIILPSDEIIQYCLNPTVNNPDIEYIFIEGVGGIMVPLTNNFTWLDLMVASKPDGLILVSGSYLGSINHTLLTYHTLISSKIPVTAIILNESDVDSVDMTDTAQTLKNFCSCPILLCYRNDNYGTTIEELSNILMQCINN